ncbi:MAG: hypothetical protein JRI23_24770, partial [Deltaproteobacteria bacterium]|nr:hypothetical protein [Deltaproteobacteria bacterium]MBW2535217.1 hypothetical protein [Deltaproteobacteria bacterium]
MIRTAPDAAARWAPALQRLAVLAAALGLACNGDEPTQPTQPTSTAATKATATATASASAPLPADAGASKIPLPPGELVLAGAYDDLPDPEAPLTAKELPIYRIEQRLDDGKGVFEGAVTIEYPNHTGGPLAELPLLIHPNASRELGVAPARSGGLSVKRIVRHTGGTREGTQVVVFTQERPTLVVAQLEPPVPTKELARLTVHYEGQLRRLGPGANDLFAQALGSMGMVTAGAGAADYGLVAVGDGILTAASAYPMVAPFRDGAFDTGEPLRFGDLAYNQPARFEVRTIVPAGLEVVTNLVDGATGTLAPGWEVTPSAGSFVRDFVLVAGRDLSRSSRHHGKTRVTSVYRKRDEEAGKRVLEAAVASLACFEKHFGPYPYAELDVVEASLVGGAGGVEFSTMVLIAGMLYRDPADSLHPIALLLQLTG